MGGDEDELIVMSKKNCNFVPKRKGKSPGFRRLEAVSILELLSTRMFLHGRGPGG